VGANLQGKRGRGLVLFDLSGTVPTNALILSVHLTLTSAKAAGNSANSTIEAHRILQDWTEGAESGMNGAPSVSGESSWNFRSSPSFSWAQPGGQPDVDYSATPSGSQPLTGGSVAFDSTSNLVLDVQTWSQDPKSNHGWILISSAENIPQSAVRFNSREIPDSAPELTVEYSIPDPALRIEEAGKSGTSFLIHLNLEAVNTYTLQFRDNVDSGTWQIATNFPPDSSFRHIIWVEPYTNNLRRFFRFGVTKPFPGP